VVNALRGGVEGTMRLHRLSCGMRERVALRATTPANRLNPYRLGAPSFPLSTSAKKRRATESTVRHIPHKA
jgi:hypothetical protein